MTPQEFRELERGRLALERCAVALERIAEMIKAGGPEDATVALMDLAAAAERVSPDPDKTPAEARRSAAGDAARAAAVSEKPPA